MQNEVKSWGIEGNLIAAIGAYTACIPALETIIHQGSINVGTDCPASSTEPLIDI